MVCTRNVRFMVIVGRLEYVMRIRLANVLLLSDDSFAWTRTCTGMTHLVVV